MPYSVQTRIRPEAANYAASWMMRHVLPRIALQMLPCVVLYIFRNCCILIVAIRASMHLIIIRIYHIWISGHLSRLRSISFLHVLRIRNYPRTLYTYQSHYIKVFIRIYISNLNFKKSRISC